MARHPATLFTPGGPVGAGPSGPFLALHREVNRPFDGVPRGGPVPAGGRPARRPRGDVTRRATDGEEVL